MELNTIVTFINTKLAGELLTYDELKIHMDSVVDDINDKLNSTFPAFSEFDASTYEQYPNYNFFPDRYIRTVVVAGAAYKWFVTDEEGMLSAEAYQYDYSNALFIMQRDYSNSVPSEYQAQYQGYVRDESSSSSGDCGCTPELDDYFPSVRYVEKWATGGSWDGQHLTMGNYHFWVDSSGVLRYKNGPPTSESDGSAIGGLDTNAYDQAILDLQADIAALDARITALEP